MRTNYRHRCYGLIPFVAGLAGLFLPAPPAVALETKILSLETGEKPVRVFSKGQHALMSTAKGGIFRIGLKQGELVLIAEGNKLNKQIRPAGILPDGIIVQGKKDIKTAWLTGATRRYDHGVLGDDTEATGMAVEMIGGARLELTLNPDSVFEDRKARLADLDGDGKDEIIAVRSYLDEGAALAVAKPGLKGLRIIAETWPIGIPHRWLNPVGVGDFDGDGRNDVALVKTPHIGGKLEIYALENDALRLKGKTAGFSNHTIGERELDKGAVIDIDGDDIHEIVLPDSWQRTIRIISFKGAMFSEIARINLNGSSIATAIAATDLDEDGDREIVFGLSDGRIMAVLFNP